MNDVCSRELSVIFFTQTEQRLKLYHERVSREIGDHTAWLNDMLILSYFGLQKENHHISRKMEIEFGKRCWIPTLSSVDDVFTCTIEASVTSSLISCNTKYHYCLGVNKQNDSFSHRHMTLHVLGMLIKTLKNLPQNISQRPDGDWNYPDGTIRDVLGRIII